MRRGRPLRLARALRLVRFGLVVYAALFVAVWVVRAIAIVSTGPHPGETVGDDHVITLLWHGAVWTVAWCGIHLWLGVLAQNERRRYEHEHPQSFH